MSRPNKRQRADSADLGPPPLSYLGMIYQLDEKIVRNILVDLVYASPSAQGMVKRAYEQGRGFNPDEDDEEEDSEEEEEEELDFTHLVKKVWHVLNEQDTNLSGSEQDDAKAFDEILSCIEDIGLDTFDLATFDDSDDVNISFDTKLNALNALVDIASLLVASRDTLGHELRKQFQQNSCLADNMLAIVQSMTSEERHFAGRSVNTQPTLRVVSRSVNTQSNLISRVRWVRRRMEKLCLAGVDALSDVLSLFRGEVAG